MLSGPSCASTSALLSLTKIEKAFFFLLFPAPSSDLGVAEEAFPPELSVRDFFLLPLPVDCCEAEVEAVGVWTDLRFLVTLSDFFFEDDGPVSRWCWNSSRMCHTYSTQNIKVVTLYNLNIVLTFEESPARFSFTAISLTLISTCLLEQEGWS